VKNIKLHKLIYIIGAAMMIFINVLSWQSKRFSDWYVKNIFPFWLGSYGRFTSMFSISIGEVMLILGVLITLSVIILFLVNIISKGKYSKAVKIYGTFYAWLFLVVCFVMTFNCFILYHCTGFLSDSDASEGYTKSELAALRDYVVENCNDLAIKIERDETGAASYKGDIIETARQAMVNLGEDFEQLSGFYVTPKYLTFSGFFSQQNIMGYYFPFSMEANINSVMYLTNIAPTVCHELAHTKGYIYEEDANMIGFVACIKSDDVFLQYCGYLSVLNYVNNEFYDSIDKNKTVYRQHIKISDLVSDDNIFLTKEAWEKVENNAVLDTDTVKNVSNNLMDTSLKLNGVEEGVLAYNGVVGLLLQYYDGVLY
jgi:hypothetical protein